MPDLLVLSWDLTNGALKAVMEIDPDTRAPNPNEFGTLPTPNLSKDHETYGGWIKRHRDDVDWLQEQVEHYLLGHDWGIDVTAEIHWSNLMEDLEGYAYDTRRR